MFVLADLDSIACRFISQLRNVKVQNDKMRFRRNMERIGEILAYELSRTLSYKTVSIETPLGIAKDRQQEHEVVLATVLRAGLPFHQGFLNYFDDAENAFVASYRKVLNDKGNFEIQTEYMVAPSLEGKELILIDPMLATGQSLCLAYEALTKNGLPRRTHIASVIASKQGVAYVRSNLPEAELWLGAIDEGLNDKAYIVPGLGDAGDLAFGNKL